MDSDAIFYQFSRSKIERCDFSHFLNLYAPDKLPGGRRLRVMMNTMVFCIEGYDDDPLQIHSIPEIRRFYSAFHDAWPYWLYFCNLDLDTLKMMVACLVKSLKALEVDGTPSVLVEFEPLELLNFLKADFPHMNAICERAEMFPNLVAERSKQVFACFGLDYHAKPPHAGDGAVGH